MGQNLEANVAIEESAGMGEMKMLQSMSTANTGSGVEIGNLSFSSRLQERRQMGPRQYLQQLFEDHLHRER